MEEIVSSITSTLNIHLNMNQNIIFNTSAVFFSLEKISAEFLSNRLNDSHIRFPLIFNTDAPVLLRVRFSCNITKKEKLI
jgi:hypothetical protein